MSNNQVDNKIKQLREKKQIKKKKHSILKLLILFIFLNSFCILIYKLPSNNSEVIAVNDYKTKPVSSPTSKVNTSKTNISKTKTNINKNEVLISAAGDCTIGTDTKFNYDTSLPCILQKNNMDYSYFFKNVYPIFSKDDFTIANLETTFTNSTSKVYKQFNFKASPDYAKSLKLGSIEAVNLSNNHIYDYGEVGFKDTKSALKNIKINYFGEGNKYITIINNYKFAFLGYQGWNSDKAFLEKVKNDIIECKKLKATTIINFHWGNEGHYYPNDGQKQLAHFAIDNGADLIIGHHPHVIQGIEKYKNKFICYSLGNFCFGGNSNPRDKRTFILQTKFKYENNNLSSIGLKVIPCSISSVSHINDYKPTPLTGDKKTALLSKLNEISPNAGFKISDEFFFTKIQSNK